MATTGSAAAAKEPVPAQPHTWQLAAVDSFMAATIPRFVRDAPAGSMGIALLAPPPSAAYVSDSVEVYAYVFGDQPAATRAEADIRRRAAVDRRVFRSSNLVIVVTPRTAPIGARLEDVLTSRALRSALPSVARH